MAIRIVQVCGLWFWVAFAFFVFVVIHQSQSILPVTTTGNLRHGPGSSKLPEPIRSKGLSTRQRMARSETAWRTSVTLRHEMAAKHPDNPNIPFFPAQELHLFGQYPYTLWDFFPATYTCPHDIQRVGRLGDGGKWVCGMSLYEARPAPSASHPGDETIIYSFGVNDESTFEAEMLARVPSAVIYAFDYSVTSFGPQLDPAHQGRAHFKQVGLGNNDEPTRTPEFFTLNTLMAQNKHTYMDILKIDVEGSEYQAFDTFMDWVDANGGVMPIGQVMIELHLMDDQTVNFERFTAWWERLEGFGMRPTWLEVNLMAVTLGKGKTDPRCVEYVWINSKDPKSILLAE